MGIDSVATGLAMASAGSSLDLSVLKSVTNLESSQAAQLVDATMLSSGSVDTYA